VTPLDENRQSLRSFVASALVFGVAFGAFLRIVTGSWYYGFHGGLLAGFAFALSVRLFLKVATSTSHLELDGRAAGFEASEEVVRFALANHYRGIEAVGGKLYLTDRRLRFRSHKLNLQRCDESYPLDAILAVEPARTFGIIPNAIVVRLRDGRRERFVVNAQREWLEAISRRLRVP
jgi:hypothetical protein